MSTKDTYKRHFAPLVVMDGVALEPLPNLIQDVCTAKLAGKPVILHQLMEESEEKIIPLVCILKINYPKCGDLCPIASTVKGPTIQ